MRDAGGACSATYDLKTPRHPVPRPIESCAKYKTINPLLGDDDEVVGAPSDAFASMKEPIMRKIPLRDKANLCL